MRRPRKKDETEKDETEKEGRGYTDNRYAMSYERTRACNESFSNERTDDGLSVVSTHL